MTKYKSPNFESTITFVSENVDFILVSKKSQKSMLNLSENFIWIESIWKMTFKKQNVHFLGDTLYSVLAINWW